jgi:hypothetical protein
MLKASANGKKFSIDTLCGEKVGGVESARETEIWPFTSQGSPAISVRGAGSCSSTQQRSFTVSAIPTVMPKPEPAPIDSSSLENFPAWGLGLPDARHPGAEQVLLHGYE